MINGSAKQTVVGMRGAELDGASFATKIGIHREKDSAEIIFSIYLPLPTLFPLTYSQQHPTRSGLLLKISIS